MTQTDAHETPGQADQTQQTCLRLDKVGTHGAGLGLRPGDVLSAVNGIRLTGPESRLHGRFGKNGARTCALTFQRGEKSLTVLSARADLGRWAEIVPDAALQRQVEREQTGRLYPDHMHNYEIYANRVGEYDLQPLRCSPLALIAAPLWLAQMRLWAPMAVLLGVVLVAIPTGWVMMGLIYLLASIYVWRAGPALFRADRAAAGLRPQMILAAAHERGAHEAYAAYAPGARSIYARRKEDSDEAVAEASVG